MLILLLEILSQDVTSLLIKGITSIDLGVHSRIFPAYHFHDCWLHTEKLWWLRIDCFYHIPATYLMGEGRSKVGSFQNEIH